jgi:hypothetical protein
MSEVKAEPEQPKVKAEPEQPEAKEEPEQPEVKAEPVCWFIIMGYWEDVKGHCDKKAENGVDGACCAPCRGRKRQLFNGSWDPSGAFKPSGTKDFGHNLPREPETLHAGQMENWIPTQK